MSKAAQWWNWYKRQLWAPLRWLAFMIGVFSRNRNRAAAVFTHHRVAAVLKTLSVLTLLAWILIWMLASEADRQRLTEAVSDYWSDLRAPATTPETTDAAAGQ